MNPDGSDSRDFFGERYGQQRSDAARRVEQRVLGQEVGLQGYTTVDQARRLGRALGLTSTSRLLDVGSGRGWPGAFIAGTSSCRAILADIPPSALEQGRRYAEERGVSDRVRAVCADGRTLPFSPECFDAVVHADVLC